MISLVSAQNLANDDHLTALNDHNFDGFLAAHSQVIVIFYTPWCTKCREIMPELSKAAEKFAQVHPSARFCKIDAETNLASLKKYQIKDFPSVVTFINGKIRPYTGPMEASGVINWLSRFLQSNFVFASEDLQLDSIITRDAKVVVAYAPVPSDDFQKAARTLKSLEFVVVLDPALAAKRHEKFGSTVLYFNQDRVVFQPGHTELIDWLIQKTEKQPTQSASCGKNCSESKYSLHESKPESGQCPSYQASI